MPYLRFSRWRHATPLAPHVAVCSSGRRYVWKGDQEGVVNVDYKQDVEELLNPIGDRQSDYELAYEKYGISFDATGKEQGDLHTASPGPEAEPVEARRGRPPKR
mgnify:CR=1 FL=1